MDPVEQTIWIHTKHWNEMRAHVARRCPEESCGLVAGKERRSQAVFPVENVLGSPVRFRMEPYQQLKAFIKMDERDWDLLAIYHSHPLGPPVPSPTDVAEAAYPDAVNLIFFKAMGAWTCRGFLIRDGEVCEVRVNLIGQ